MKRLALLLTAAGILACASGPRLHRSTETAAVPFRIDGALHVGTPQGDELVWSEVPMAGHYEGVVIATWCPDCERLVKARRTDPEIAAETPNLFYFDDEAIDRVGQKADAGKLGHEEAQTAIEELERTRQRVTYPERLDGLGAHAVRASEIPASFVPFFFSCDDGRCEGWEAEGF